MKPCLLVRTNEKIARVNDEVKNCQSVIGPGTYRCE